MATEPKSNVAVMSTADGKQCITNRQAAITAVSVTGTYATDDTPIETAINAIITALEAHGLIASND
jgi:hypothetical protein